MIWVYLGSIELSELPKRARRFIRKTMYNIHEIPESWTAMMPATIVILIKGVPMYDHVSCTQVKEVLLFWEAGVTYHLCNLSLF